MQNNNITKEALALVTADRAAPIYRVLADVIGAGATITRADVLRVYTAFRYAQEWSYWRSRVLAGDVLDVALLAFTDGVRYGRMTGVDASEMSVRDWVVFLDHIHGDDVEWWLRDDDEDEDDD